MLSVTGPESSVLEVVSPASRAYMGWQLAAHWGNRRFARPGPRIELVSAALLAGWGWVEAELDAVSDTRRPASTPAHPELARWRLSVARAAQMSRYVALLLAARFADRAEGATARFLEVADTAGARAAQTFRAEMVRRAAAWREDLAADGRYQAALSNTAFTTSLALLAAWEGLVDGLCEAGSSPFVVTAPARGGEALEVALRPLGDWCWRARPWPLEGQRVQLHCEVRRGGSGDSSEGTMVERVTFTLLRPGARRP